MREFAFKWKGWQRMRTSYRRYELLVPQNFKDGRPVPNELIGETVSELRQQFGAVASETQTIQGEWVEKGKVYRDDLLRVFVDVRDTSTNRRSLRDCKKRLKARFAGRRLS
jgi:hypothetical protein